jgi:hypothetical protein
MPAFTGVGVAKVVPQAPETPQVLEPTHQMPHYLLADCATKQLHH